MSLAGEACPGGAAAGLGREASSARNAPTGPLFPCVMDRARSAVARARRRGLAKTGCVRQGGRRGRGGAAVGLVLAHAVSAPTVV